MHMNYTVYKQVLFLILIISIIGNSISRAAEAEKILRLGLPYRDLIVSVPKMKSAPVIDGKVDAGEWEGAGMSPRLITARDDGDDRLTQLESRFYFGYTDDSVYLAFQIQRP